MAGFPLTGVDPNDPIPHNIIEIRFAQGQGTGAGNQRAVLLLGNKTSAGSEGTNELNEQVADADDMVARVGRRSELYQEYRTYVKTDPNAPIYFIAVPEGGGATAATRTNTFATTASATTTFRIGFVGEQTEFSIVSGDIADTIAANYVTAFNNMIDWPATAAAVGAVVTITCANLGPRGDQVLGTLTNKFIKPCSTTATLAAVSSGTTDDDFTTALGLLDKRPMYYQVNPKTTTSTVTATDNGIGEHAAFITAQALPSVGNRCEMIFALRGTNAQGITTATSVNNPRVFPIWSENSLMSPPMLAAQWAAIKRSGEIVQPGARLTGYGKGASDLFFLPPPFSSADRPTQAEVRAALNNGFTPVDFLDTGQAFVVRHVTSRSLNGSNNDYRVRSGHIVSALDFAADFIKDRVSSVAQPFIADTPPEGSAPIPFTTTPSEVAAEIRVAIELLTTQTSGPVLDPSVLAEMQASVQVVRLINGWSARMQLEAVKHNDKQETLIDEVSPGI